MAFSTDIGIDLGTTNILIYIRGRGMVLNEPAVVAVEQKLQKLLAVGSTAQKMLGRTPENIVALRPLREGVIAEFDFAEMMLKRCLAMALKRKHLLRPRIVVCIPAATTPVEQKAVLEAIARTGARETFLIEEPRAAALGANLDVFEVGGNMVVDIGGGTSDIAVLSMVRSSKAPASARGDKLIRRLSGIKKSTICLVAHGRIFKDRRRSGIPEPHLETEVRAATSHRPLPVKLNTACWQARRASILFLQGSSRCWKGCRPSWPISSAKVILRRRRPEGLLVLPGDGDPLYLAEEPLTA